MNFPKGFHVDDETIINIALGSLCCLGVLGAIGFFVLSSIFKTRFGINLAAVFAGAKCAACGAPLPAVARIPKTPYQVLWGGWTCEECGLELDKWGNPR
jgi:hypothetical protein